jgi:hypothetical protein
VHKRWLIILGSRRALFLALLLAAPVVRGATTNVPLAALTVSDRALVRPVVEHSTLRREYAARTFRGQRKQFEFLMDHMAACSMLSEALGLISYRVVEVEPNRTFADDRDGAQGFLQQVYCADGERVYYVEGTQQGMMQATGRGVVIVKFTQTAPDTIEYTGKMFVKIDNKVLAALSQIFFVFVKSSVDKHFDHVMNQPIKLSALALDEPAMLRECIETMAPEDSKALRPFAETLRR